MPRSGRRPIRLGLVIGQLTAGGAEGQLWLLCRGIDRTRFSPVVYCLSDRSKPYGPQIEALGVPVHGICGTPLLRAQRLRRALRADRIDVVHTWLFIANAYAWIATVGARRPLVTSARNCKRQGRLLTALNRMAFGASDAIVANSSEVGHYIKRVYRAPAERIRVVYNAIDTDRYRPAEQPRHDEFCIATVGRLVPQKNPGLFVAAAALVHQEAPQTRFVMIGDGPLRAEVAAQVHAAGLAQCFTLTGERGDIPELLRHADLFWLTSEWEGLPNVVLEAMATGVPVVATDVGGTRELVRHGQDGFLIRAGDQDALVSHSLDLLRDVEKRRQFGRAARARAEAFAPRQMVLTMQDLYARVMQEQRA